MKNNKKLKKKDIIEENTKKSKKLKIKELENEEEEEEEENINNKKLKKKNLIEEKDINKNKKLKIKDEIVEEINLKQKKNKKIKNKEIDEEIYKKKDKLKKDLPIQTLTPIKPPPLPETLILPFPTFVPTILAISSVIIFIYAILTRGKPSSHSRRQQVQNLIDGPNDPLVSDSKGDFEFNPNEQFDKLKPLKPK